MVYKVTSEITVQVNRRLASEVLVNQAVTLFSTISYAQSQGVDLCDNPDIAELFSLSAKLAGTQLFPRQGESPEEAEARQAKYIAERADDIGRQAVTRWAMYKASRSAPEQKTL